VVPAYEITCCHNAEVQNFGAFLFETQRAGGEYKIWLCEIWGSCSGIAEYSSLLGCRTVSLGLSYMVFWRSQHLHLQNNLFHFIHPLYPVHGTGHVNNWHSFKFTCLHLFKSVRHILQIYKLNSSKTTHHLSKRKSLLINEIYFHLWSRMYVVVKMVLPLS
jgi:hypothetical protein